MINCTADAGTTGAATTGAEGGEMSSFFWIREYSRWNRDWNDHDWLNEHKGDPLLGGLYKRRYQELYDAERKREQSDYRKNTGTSGSQYWTHDYSGNPSYYSTSGYMFEVSEAIMSLYGLNRKW